LCAVDDNWKVDPFAPCTPTLDSRIELTVVVTVPGQVVKINKYFANAYSVNRGDGTTTNNLTSDTSKAYAQAGTYTVMLTLADGANRWTFQDTAKSLAPRA